MLLQQTYENFLTEVKERILDFIPGSSDMQARIKKVTKTNDVVLDCLLIIRKGQNYSPSIYLNGYYEEVLSGLSLENVLEKISNTYLSYINKPNFENFDLCNIDNIYVTVINKDLNKELLENVPYLEFEDLAIVFKYLADISDDGLKSILLKNDIIPDMDINELYEIALHNTRRLLGTTIRPINQVITEIITDREDIPQDVAIDVLGLDIDENSNPMYVVSNSMNINGAAIILFTDMFESLANKLNSDLYILPSSVHELLAVPVFKPNLNSLKEMVKEVNMTQVAPDEILSNNIYIYKRDTKKITIC